MATPDKKIQTLETFTDEEMAAERWRRTPPSSKAISEYSDGEFEAELIRRKSAGAALGAKFTHSLERLKVRVEVLENRRVNAAAD